MRRSDRVVEPLRDLRWAVVAVVAALASILVVKTVSNTGPQVRVPDGRVVLTLNEYRIDPRNIRLPSGPVRIEVRNTGRLLHSVRIISDDDKRGGRRETFATSVPPAVEPGERRVMRFRTLINGETRSDIAVCLAPGRYRIISGQPSDEELGMVADVRVDGPAAPCTPPDAKRARERREPDEN